MPIKRFEAKQSKSPGKSPTKGTSKKGGKQAGAEGARKKTWRENIEALTVAVLVALVLKGFVIEVSKIPSGSMQPTLMGSPAAGVFDRVIVDKLSFVHRDPRRFEVVVFRHPLERSRNMVKRLVGLPGEYLRIANGDLWTRRDESSEWRVLRRPESVQAVMWKDLPPLSPVLSDWKPESGDKWKIEGNRIVAGAEGVVRFRSDVGIRNTYLDGYPDSIRTKILEARQRDPRRFGFPPSDQPVGDVKLEGDLEAPAGLIACEIVLSEGDAEYVFRVAGPASESPSGIEVRTGRGSDQVSREVLGEDLRLDAGNRVSFRVENLDDRVALFVDGDLVAETEVAPVERPVSSLSIRIRGEGAELDDLAVARDIHYLPSRTGASEIHIPEGHYFVLGDNTLDSADGREWQFVTVELEDEDGGTRELVANYRGNGENPSVPVVSEGHRVQFLRDQWGERYTLPAGTPGLAAPESFHLVSRDLIQGRAVSVFWPILPWRGIYRLGWIQGG